MQSLIESFESLAVGFSALMTGIAALLGVKTLSRSERSKTDEPPSAAFED